MSDKPRFLAPRARQGDGTGYLNQPLRRELPEGLDQFELADDAARAQEATRPEDEPECIGPAILDSYVSVNKRIHSQRHIMEVMDMREHVRPLLRAEDRIRDAERRAKQARRRDLKGEFVALRGMLARYQRADQEPKPESSLLRRLEGVETKLDGLDQQAA